MSKIPHRKGFEPKPHEYNCHIGLSCVVNCEQSEPLGESNYYQGFEFCPEDTVRSWLVEYAWEYADAYSAYLFPYFLDPTIYNEGFNESYIEDPVLTKICSTCESLSGCITTVKEGFSRKLVLNIYVSPRAFCIEEEDLTSCDVECKVCQKFHKDTPYSPNKLIHVYDLRVFGHPVEVCIHYKYFRCSNKTYGINHLPGIHDGSGYNNHRFTCRLAMAINTALAENLRLTYISEASAVPLTTIQRWKARAIKLSDQIHESASVLKNFTNPDPVLVSSTIHSIHRKNFVFVFHHKDAIDFLHAIYTKSEWELMKSLVSGDYQPRSDFSDTRFLNLAYDYLSCCTEIPPAIGAMVVTNTHQWVSSQHSQHMNLLAVTLDRIRNQMGPSGGWSFQYSYGRSWDKLSNLLQIVSGSKKDIFSAVIQSLHIYADQSATSTEPIPGFLSWYQETCQNHPGVSMSSKIHTRPRLFDAISEHIICSPLPRQEIIDRLLHFNPAALPHRDSRFGQRRYLFTENGDFDSTQPPQSQVPLTELLRMLQAGLLRDDLSVPISERLRQNSN